MKGDLSWKCTNASSKSGRKVGKKISESQFGPISSFRLTQVLHLPQWKLADGIVKLNVNLVENIGC
jgi:hypothetical protein